MHKSVKSKSRTTGIFKLMVLLMSIGQDNHLKIVTLFNSNTRFFQKSVIHRRGSKIITFSANYRKWSEGERVVFKLDSQEKRGQICSGGATAHPRQVLGPAVFGQALPQALPNFLTVEKKFRMELSYRKESITNINVLLKHKNYEDYFNSIAKYESFKSI